MVVEEEVVRLVVVRIRGNVCCDIDCTRVHAWDGGGYDIARIRPVNHT